MFAEIKMKSMRWRKYTIEEDGNETWKKRKKWRSRGAGDVEKSEGENVKKGVSGKMIKERNCNRKKGSIVGKKQEI